MRRLQLVLFAATTLAVAASASGQTGRMTGTVKDENGKAIRGATVRASSETAILPITSTTDDKGRFAMIGLRSGAWKIVVEAPDFLPFEGYATVAAGFSPATAAVLRKDPGPVPGSLAKSVADDVSGAEALRQAGRYDDAIAAYQSIQAKNSRLTSVSLMLGALYRDKAQQVKDSGARHALLELAIAAYSDMLKSDEANTRARIELGVTQMAAGNAEAATKAFQDVIAANPTSAAAAEATAHLHEIRK